MTSTRPDDETSGRSAEAGFYELDISLSSAPALDETLEPNDQAPALIGGLPAELSGQFIGDAPGPIVDMGAYERLPGDSGGDGVIGRVGTVNLLDYAGFEACVGMPPVEPPWACECFDLDGSGWIDLLDFAVFQVTFTGG